MQVRKHFVVGTLVVVLIGLAYLLTIEKGDFILLLNAKHTDTWNAFFLWCTSMVELPVYIVLGIFYYFVNKRFSLLIGLSGCLTVVVSLGLKSLFLHKRPILYFSDELLCTVNWIPNYFPHEGFTSFPSGHSMAAFALFYVLSYIYQNKYFDYFFLTLAVLAALSRSYLFNHFLQDILVGSLIGLVIALFSIYMISNIMPTKSNTN